MLNKIETVTITANKIWYRIMLCTKYSFYICKYSCVLIYTVLYSYGLTLTRLNEPSPQVNSRN